MKVMFISIVVALEASSTSAFAPIAAFHRGLSQSTTNLFSSEPDEGDGLDLNLEEMFDM